MSWSDAGNRRERAGPGRGGGLSLEAPEGVRFLLRSRLLTEHELVRLAAQPPPPTGAAEA